MKNLAKTDFWKTKNEKKKSIRNNSNLKSVFPALKQLKLLISGENTNYINTQHTVAFCLICALASARNVSQSNGFAHSFHISLLGCNVIYTHSLAHAHTRTFPIRSHTESTQMQRIHFQVHFSFDLKQEKSPRNVCLNWNGHNPLLCSAHPVGCLDSTDGRTDGRTHTHTDTHIYLQYYCCRSKW